jgi:hypothetical protein
LSEKPKNASGMNWTGILVGLLLVFCLPTLGWFAGTTYYRMDADIKSASGKADTVGQELLRTREDVAKEIGGLRVELAGMRGDLKESMAMVRGEIQTMNTRLGSIEESSRLTLEELRRLPNVQPPR